MANPFKKREPNRRERRLQKGALAEVVVEEISLVMGDWEPVNGKGFVMKGGRKHPELARVTKMKSEVVGSEGLIYLTLMEPEVKDKQKDHYPQIQVDKAMETFAERGRMVNIIDVNHNHKPDPEFFVRESYKLKAADPEYYPNTKLGSWVSVVKCKNLQNPNWIEFQKSGKGASIFGKCIDMDDEGTLEAVKSEMLRMRGILEKAGNIDAVKELDERLAELEKSQNTPELDKLIKAFSDVIEGMNRVVAKGLQNEPGEDAGEDKTVSIDGKEIVIKSAYKEIYKAIADIDGPVPMALLESNLQGLFIDEVIADKDDDTFGEITVAPIMKDETIDAGMINDLTFKNSADGTPTSQDVPTGSIPCPSSTLYAEMRMHYDTVEFYKDKYGMEAFGAYVNNGIAMKARKALKLLFFRGDRSSSTAKLKGLDGVVTKATAAGDVVSVSGTWEQAIEQALLTFDEEVLLDKSSFRIYVNPKDLIRIRGEAKKEANVVAGRLTLDGKDTYYDGIPIKERYIAEGKMIIGLVKFTILGFRSDAMLYKEFKDWYYYWKMRVRFGVTYVSGRVKVVNVESVPYATGVSISGKQQVGEKLTGNYTFNDPNGDTELGTGFRWLSCATPSGTFEAISGATSQAYTLASGDEGKYVKFEVTPRSASGNMDGVAVLSNRTIAIVAE
jgi:Putative phage serine protease XkdF